MDALVKNWIELSLISGCKLAGDIFQDMQPSASDVLNCSISFPVMQSVVPRCRYNCVILQTKNLYTIFSYVDSSDSTVRR